VQNSDHAIKINELNEYDVLFRKDKALFQRIRGARKSSNNCTSRKNHDPLPKIIRND